MAITNLELKEAVWAMLFFFAFIWLADGIKEWIESMIGNGNKLIFIGAALFLFILYKRRYLGSRSFVK